MQTIQETDTPEAGITMWWIGQSGFFIKLTNGKIILIDAYLSASVEKSNPLFRRLIPVPVMPADVICDYYLCTHNHLDHTDPDTIQQLAFKHKMTFIGPRNSIKSFKQLGVPEKNIRLIEAGDTIEFDEFSLTATFCIPNGDKVLDSIGFVLKTVEGITIYHTGDTGYHRFLGYIKQYEADVMMTCINGKYGNMNIKQAFALAETINPAIVIPTHFEMFEMNAADPNLFAVLFGNNKHSECILPVIGKPIHFSKLKNYNKK